jgi:steroid delta-isomerase-like uncharacterized protein
MAEDIKKVLYRRFVEEVINGSKFDVVPELFSPDYVDHNAPPGAHQGSVYDSIKGIPVFFRSAFPDVHFTIDDMVSEGDWVATRVTGRGTHLNKPFMGIEPTGRRVSWKSMGFFRVADGRIVEHYGQPDLGSLRQQLAAPFDPNNTLEYNRMLVARYVYATNTRDYSKFYEYVDPAFVDHDPVPGQQPGIDGLINSYKMFDSAMPDSWYTFEDLIAENDMVIGRGVIQGTHTGTFVGVPATHKTITWTGTRMFRIKNGKVSEGWINFDMIRILQQMGVVPAPNH